MPKNIDKDNYYSITETARILGVSRVTIWKRIQAGKLKAERIGHIFAIPKSEFGHIKATELTEAQKKVIEEGVKKTVKEYGETLKRLGNE